MPPISRRTWLTRCSTRQPSLASSGLQWRPRQLPSLGKRPAQQFQALVARRAKDVNDTFTLRLLCCESLTHLETLAPSMMRRTALDCTALLCRGNIASGSARAPWHLREQGQLVPKGARLYQDVLQLQCSGSVSVRCRAFSPRLSSPAQRNTPRFQTYLCYNVAEIAQQELPVAAENFHGPMAFTPPHGPL